MKTKQTIGLVVAVILFIVTGVASVVTNNVSDSIFDKVKEEVLSGDVSFAPPASDYIAVVDIVGTIQEQSDDYLYDSGSYRHTTNMNYVDKLMDDENNQGILLYVDSPGGTVYESQEMYDKIMEYKETTGRPVYAYMAHTGASGAYMISMAADKIYANQNVTTGSIGVIMSGYDISGLYKKLGIREINITSGKNKAATFSDEQIALYQEQVDEYYETFVSIVAKGRDMSVKEVKKLADGRVYTAKQAIENGLIDEIASYEDAKEMVARTIGTSNYYSLKGTDDFWASLFAKAEKLIPKSDSQILKETADELESGVFMYYAQ